MRPASFKYCYACRWNESVWQLAIGTPSRHWLYALIFWWLLVLLSIYFLIYFGCAAVNRALSHLSTYVTRQLSVLQTYDNQGKLAVTISNRLYNGTVSVFGVLNDRFIQTSILFTLEIIAKSGFECSRPVAKFWSNFLQGKFQSRPGRALLRMTARVSHVWVCFCTWKTRKSFNYDEFDSLITNAINFALACSRC